MKSLHEQFKLVNNILDKEDKIFYAQGEREIVDAFFLNFKDFAFLDLYKELSHSALGITMDAKNVLIYNKQSSPKIDTKIKLIYRKLILKFKLRGYDPFTPLEK